METGGKEHEIWSGEASAVLDLASGDSVPVRYHPCFGSHDDLLLLEADEKIVPDILHNQVSIRGQPDEQAVLCTASATYAIKFVSTSNSVFLIPPGDSICSNSEVSHGNPDEDRPAHTGAVASVIKVALGNMELVQAAPKLEKLKSLLAKRPYTLEEDLEIDSQSKRGLYSWRDLVELIQASEEELKIGLKSLSAVELDGYWRIVDEKSMDEILNMILNNSILHDWDLNALGEDNLLSVLESDGFPRRIVLHSLDTYGTRMDGMEGCLWSLDEKKVCIHIAIRVLGGDKMKLESFTDKWMRKIPSGMNACLEMLEGEVLYDRTGVETWIRPFSVAALPSTPAERFAALFRERPKWEWKDLEPFIRDLRVPGLSAEGLLIKYTRRMQPSADAEPIFSAR